MPLNKLNKLNIVSSLKKFGHLRKIDDIKRLSLDLWDEKSGQMHIYSLVPMFIN